MTDQLEVPAIGDPVDWLETQLKMGYADDEKVGLGGHPYNFYKWARGFRISELRPKMALCIPAQWAWKYPTVQSFVQAMNGHLASKPEMFGQARVVYDPVGAVTMADSIRFRHV